MKEFERKMVRAAIIETRNDIIGGIENSYLDYSEEEFIDLYNGRPTKESIINTIYRQLTSSKYIVLQNGLCVEAKHIKFLGKEKIMEMITELVEKDIVRNNYEWLLG